MSYNVKQFIEHIIRPTIIGLNANSLSAEQLLAGTCAVESNFGEYIKQVNGPAMGPYQMEPQTHEDCWDNYILNRTQLHLKICSIANIPWSMKAPGASIMMYNAIYATCMARVKYMRVSKELPGINDWAGMAKYWKKYYNTPQGKGKEFGFMESLCTFGIKDYYQGK